MMQTAAMQQRSLKARLRARREETAVLPRLSARHVRGRTDPLAGIPRNSPLLSMPPPGRLRLVGEGRDPARKVWRLKMETSNVAVKLPGLSGALRLLSAARALLALVGLAVVLTVVLPAPREAALR